MDPGKTPKKRAAEAPPDRDRRGVAAVEYCLVAALIGSVIVSVVSVLGASIETPLNTIAAAIAAPRP